MPEDSGTHQSCGQQIAPLSPGTTAYLQTHLQLNL